MVKLLADLVQWDVVLDVEFETRGSQARIGISQVFEERLV